MTHEYPYKSELRKELKDWREGWDYALWKDKPFPEILKGPIIEIGGPTNTGFYFLDDLQLESEPIITNISDDPMPYSSDAAQLATQVSKIVDATQMNDYEDSSVGAFLMAAMSVSSDWWVSLDDDAKQKAEEQFEAEFHNAKLEMGQAAAGVLALDQVKDAQRIKIYREVHRVLRSGGLFLTDGGIEEIAVLRALGFKLVAFLQYIKPEAEGWQEPNYEFIVAKL